MRGSRVEQLGMFSYVSVEDRVPEDHPLRAIRKLVDKALAGLDNHLECCYSHTGRPSIPPERLLRALLVQVLYSIRSERQLIEQLDYNLLYRWFVGLAIDDPVWDHSTFTKNRDRLIDKDVARGLLLAIVEQARAAELVSDTHFSVDGTLIEAWASHKSFRPKDNGDEPPADGGRNPEVDFHGTERKNDTHASVTDPESRLYRKANGKEAKLCYQGHVLMENRSGLIVDAMATSSTGTAEREAALDMVNRITTEGAITLGADKGYDCASFVAEMRRANVLPHIAQNTTNRTSAVPDEIAATEGYAVSLRKRKMCEEPFGWGKAIGLLRKAKIRGVKRIDWLIVMTMCGFNLVKMRKLMPA